MARKAIVLVSGGLDSATCLYYAKKQKFEITAISFDYQQRHKIELNYAKKLASLVGVNEHIIFPIDLTLIGGSALTDDIHVPKDSQNIGQSDTIPITYVPARNLIFLSISAAFAESRQINTVFIGANILDYSGYPDCRPAFFTKFKEVYNLATKAGQTGESLEVKTPLIELSKSEIIQLGTNLDLPYEYTWSCYDPQDDTTPCKRCDACILRSKGFSDAGITDPFIC